MMPTAPGKTGSSWENDNLDDGSAGALRNRDRMGDVTLRGRGVGDSSVLREPKAATAPRYCFEWLRSNVDPGIQRLLALSSRWSIPDALLRSCRVPGRFAGNRHSSILPPKE